MDDAGGSLRRDKDSTNISKCSSSSERTYTKLGYPDNGIEVEENPMKIYTDYNHACCKHKIRKHFSNTKRSDSASNSSEETTDEDFCNTSTKPSCLKRMNEMKCQPKSYCFKHHPKYNKEMDFIIRSNIRMSKNVIDNQRNILINISCEKCKDAVNHLRKASKILENIIK